MCQIFIHKYTNKVQKLILKARQGELLKSWYRKELVTLNMFLKNKRSKLRQAKNDEI